MQLRSLRVAMTQHDRWNLTEPHPVLLTTARLFHQGAKLRPIGKSVPAMIVSVVSGAVLLGGGSTCGIVSAAAASHSRAGSATVSVATDAPGDQTIDLRRVAVRTTAGSVKITINTYDPVSNKTLSQCGRILVSLGQKSSITMTSTGDVTRARARDGRNVHRAKVYRPNGRTFSVTVSRAFIPSYPQTGSWLAAAQGGGFCEGPLREDAVPDRGRIAP